MQSDFTTAWSSLRLYILILSKFGFVRLLPMCGLVNKLVDFTFDQSYDYIYYKIGPVVQEEEIFKFRECTFAILLISPYVKRCRLSIWTNLNFLHTGILFAKFGWNWHSGSIQDHFLIFRYSCNYLPLEKCVDLHWIKLYTLHSKMLCAISLVEIGPLVL